MTIPREFIDLILAKTDLVQTIHAVLPLRKKSGSNYFARCPFHQEKSASFSVSQTKQFYYCFGCGAHGNVIDFLMQHDRLSFVEAIQTLASFLGIEIPQSTNTHPKKEDSSPDLYDLLNKTSKVFHEQMRKSERAIDYLKRRGISGSMAQQFQLGYALNSWNHVLNLFGKTEEDKNNLLEVGLIIKKNEGGYYDRFRDRIIFPIQDYRGRIIGFGGRIIDEGEPKYLNSPETPLFQKGDELYGLFHALKAARELEHLIVVEGYLDVIALFQHGITAVVATLGTATTAYHLQKLFRYTKALIFCFDGDEAGKRAAQRVLPIIFPLMQDDLQIRFLFLPDGEDPDSLIRKEGKNAFLARLPKAPSLSSFFFQTLAKQSDLVSIEGRAKFAASAIHFMKQLPPGIFQGILLEELSRKTRVNLEELKLQLHTAIKERTKDPLAFNEEEPKAKVSSAIRLALVLLIQHPELSEYIEEPLPKSSVRGYAFLSQLIEILKKNRPLTTGSLREYFRGQQEEKWITSLATINHMIPDHGYKSEFLGAMRQINIQGLDEAINQLLAKGSLLEAEKLELSALIAKKKGLISPRHDS